jgi:glucan phosphoethanolaminetransferase (alkaline phosphatase superfamily)
MTDRTGVSSRSVPPAGTGTIARLWRGEVPLVQAYWLYGALLGLLFNVVGFVVAEAAPQLVLLWWLLRLAYVVLIVVAIWRSSERYQGPKIWSALARISVMLSIGYNLIAIYVQLKYRS